MNRVLRIFATLLLSTCLLGVALALTILRPHSEVYSPTFEEGDKWEGIPMRSRLQVTRHWKLYPLREWGFAPLLYNCWGPAPSHGWQFGPFFFKEEHWRSSWPVAVEKAAHTMAAQQLNLKKPELTIQDHFNSSPQYWHVVASGPGGKRLEMDFDKNGKLLLRKSLPK